MNIDKIREYGKENKVPITLDESMKFIINYLNESKTKTVLEIGTAIAFGTLNMASVGSVERVDSVEINEDIYKIALKNVKESKLKDKINLYLDDAYNFLKTCDKKYDFIYLDGPKGQYLKYYPILKKLLNDGGTIIADNMFFHGMVEGNEVPRSCKTMIKKLREFREFIKVDKEVSSEILNIGDGLALIKLKNKS